VSGESLVNLIFAHRNKENETMKNVWILQHENGYVHAVFSTFEQATQWKYRNIQFEDQKKWEVKLRTLDLPDEKK